MRKFIAACLLVLMTAPLYAIENDEVLYSGGTVPSIKQNTMGRLDLTSDATLRFEHSPGKLEIPYTRIESWNYYREVAHHLGVLPAIAVGLVKRRERKHFFLISYRDENDTAQAAIFEVSKKMPKVLQAALETRVPKRKCNSGAISPRGTCAGTQGFTN